MAPDASMSSTPSDQDSTDSRGDNSRRRNDAENGQLQHTGFYRSIMPRPPTLASDLAKAPTAPQSPVHPRRGRAGGPLAFPAASSDPSSLQRNARQTGPSITPASHPVRISLPSAESDPNPLPAPMNSRLAGRSNMLADGHRNISRPLPYGQYFPFRHSRRRASRPPDTPLRPFLLGLPMETRYMIYKLLLVAPNSMELTTRASTTKFKVPALLHVNQQIREEASHIWYGLNQFVITVRHGETALVRDFLTAIASLPSPRIGRLDIILSTCFECNHLVAVAALLIATNVPAHIKCTRGVYHFGHPQVQPCSFSLSQAITEQYFRPSVATALMKCSKQQLTGCGFVVEGESGCEYHSFPSSFSQVVEIAYM